MALTTTQISIGGIILMCGSLLFFGFMREKDFHKTHCQVKAHELPADFAAKAHEAQQELEEQVERLKELLRQEKERVADTVEKIVYRDSALDFHNESIVLQAMTYWKGSKFSRQIASIEKYLLFDIDCGGFNNIRMAFEYHIIWAWLTHRTLVLPPVRGWYLLDHGPIKVLAADGAPVPQGGVSRWADYFDMESLRAAVPVITTLEWLNLPENKEHVPEKYFQEVLSFEDRKAYFHWLLQDDNPICKGLKFKGMNQFIYWPDKAQVEARNPPADWFVDGRRGTEMDPEWTKAPALYHLTCQEEGVYRSLTQVAAAVAFADNELYLAMLALVRDNIHFADRIFEYAAKGVAELGMWQFSALHVRRNDLQYKQVFLAANQTLAHVEPLLKPNEHLYIATDEFEEGFFEAIRAKHTITRLQDLKVYPEIPRKLLGMVEVVICAAGRTFFGTRHSTFTAYIHRLRGYMNAPDSRLYWHNIQYTTSDEENVKLRPPSHGQGYMEEWDETFTLIRE